MKIWLGACSLIVTALLASCGGGSSHSPALSMSVSTTQVSVSAGLKDQAPSAKVVVTLSAAATGELWVGHASQHQLVRSVDWDETSGTTCTANLAFDAPVVQGVGTFTDTLYLGIYKDKDCKQPIANSPQAISVSYTVKIVQGPTLVSLSPSAATAGGGAFTVTATGDGFTPTTVLQWNGSSRATTFLSGTQLMAQISGADIATAGTAMLTTLDPATGAGSNALAFTVQPQAFAIASTVPAALVVNGPSFILTVNGVQFVPGSVVQWNGAARPTTFATSSQLTAQISAADIAQAGTATITVLNPAGQGGLSNAVTLPIAQSQAVGFQVGAGHSGSTTFPSVTLPAGPLWTAKLDGPPSYPLIAGGKVFVTLPIPGGAELVALDEATGAKVWGPILIGGACNAAYDAGKVLVGSQIGDATGALMQAFDAVTGSLLWSACMPGEFFLWSMPTALGGTVYATATGVGTILYAFDEGNGALLWTHKTGAGSVGGPAVTPTGVYIAGSQQAVAYYSFGGNPLWENIMSEGGGGGGSVPVVASGFAFMPDSSSGSYSGHLYDASTGALMGSFAADYPPAVASGIAYSLQQGTLRAVSLASNTILWSFTSADGLTTSPIVVNGYVFIGSTSGALYGLDAVTGAKVWSQMLGGPIPAGAGWAHQVPYSGLNAGEGMLIVPAGNALTAFKLN
jgi:outer membrane protein assembly factor BamB